MRERIENWLVGKWYGGDQAPWFLRLLEPVYHRGYQHSQEKKRSDAARYRAGVPVVVVGNITAGGSGKTPLVIRLCELVKDIGLRPGIATTGYGRQSRDTLLVDADSDTRICGDEPVMLAIKTGVPVVVATKRQEAVKQLEGMDLDVLISDDGLQTTDMERDIEFCVVDGKRGLGNGHLIPAGPLREPASRLCTVDYVVSNGEWLDRPNDLNVHVMQLDGCIVRSLDDTLTYSVDKFMHKNTGNKVHAIAGIGHPQRFFNMLTEMGIDAATHGFPDHHCFVEKDFATFESGSVIVMTEKDAVKCRSLGLNNAWYVPVEANLPAELEKMFKETLTKLLKEVE